MTPIAPKPMPNPPTPRQCCAYCNAAVKIENEIGSACKNALAMPIKPWRMWLDAPFDENPCDFFAILPPAELLRRAAKRSEQ